MAAIGRGLNRSQVRREIAFGDVDALATHRAARANRHTTPHKILFVGHSFVEGSVVALVPVESDKPKRFTSRFRDLWRKRFPIVAASGAVVDTGGTGFVNDTQLWHPFAYAGGAVSRVSGANNAPYGLGLYAVEMPVGSTLSYTWTGTGLDVHYAAFSGGGTLSAVVDGGAPQTKNTNATPADDLAVWNVATGLSHGSHALVLTATGATCYCDGVFVYDGDEAAGTHVYNGGHGGSVVKDWNRIATGWVSRWTGYAAKNLLPQTVVVCGLYNDWRTGAGSSSTIPSATWTELNTLVATFNSIPSNTPDPTIILMLEYKADTPANQANFYGGAAGWEQYRQLAFDLEAAYPNVAVLDLGVLIAPPYDTQDPTDVIWFDFVHPGPKGHALLADLLVEYLAR